MGVPKSREKSISKPSSWASSRVAKWGLRHRRKGFTISGRFPCKGYHIGRFVRNRTFAGGGIELSLEVLLKESSLDGKIWTEESSH
jgi:hypothetical protein